MFALANTQGYNAPTDTHCGTSLAAPAASGALALAMEAYRTQNSGLQLRGVKPATYRALLAHTAKDQVSATGDAVRYDAGPDFATGYGAVDALAARNMLVKKGNWKQLTAMEQGGRAELCINVPAGAAEVRATLAWDDEPGEIHTIFDSIEDRRLPVLVNNLDLELWPPSTLDSNGRIPVEEFPFRCTRLRARGVIGFGCPTVFQPWTLTPLPAGATAANVTPAVRGNDRLNNLEQVSVANPESGKWRIAIKATALPNGNTQPYSIMSSELLQRCEPAPPALCDMHPWLAGVCARPIDPSKLPPTWDPRIPIPVSEVCTIVNCPPCNVRGYEPCPPWEFAMRGVPRNARIKIADVNTGRIVSEARTIGSERVLSVGPMPPNADWVLVATDGKNAALEKPLNIEFELRSPLMRVKKPSQDASRRK